MTVKVIIIIAVAVLTTVAMFIFGKIAENKNPDDSSQKER